ncbi:acyltransferase family protein [Phreatobacter sp. HK31-P]
MTTGSITPREALSAAPGRVVSIQYLRALAALAVVVYHVLGEPAVIGAAGVDVFFVISGVVIGLITTGRTVHPLVFTYDRVTRIVPLYWIFTLLLIAVKLVAPGLLPRIPLDGGWFVQSLLLVPVTRPGTTGTFPVLYQGWTLWYEALFYALVVAAVVLAPARLACTLTAMITALVLAGLVLQPRGDVLAVYTDPLLIEFLIGYWFAVRRAEGWRPPAAGGGLLVAGGMAGFAVAALWAGSPEGWPRLIFWGLPAAALVTGAVMLEDRGRIGDWWLPQLLGDASYAIYLSHGIVVSVLLLVGRRAGVPLADPLSQPLLALAVCVMVTLAGVAVHLVLERPLMAWFRRMRPAARDTSRPRVTA